MIYTSYFENIYRIRDQVPDMTFVSIAGYSPQYFKGLHWKHFAPKKEWWNEWHNKFHFNLESPESKAFYKEKYQKTVLDNLDIDLISSDLSKYKEICMMCYELPFQFCHRHIVADWLRKFNFFVEEF